MIEGMKVMLMLQKELETRNHVMLDMETLGTGPNAVVVQMALVRFRLHDPDNATILQNVAIDFDWQDQLSQGRVITQDTLQWWMQQPDAVRGKVFGPGEFRIETEAGIESAAAFLEGVGNPVIWACPANFDIPLFEGLLQTYGIRVPWFHRDTMCLRTLCLAAGYDRRMDKRGDGHMHHDATDDCHFQIFQARRAWAKIIEREQGD